MRGKQMRFEERRREERRDEEVGVEWMRGNKYDEEVNNTKSDN